MEQPSPAELSRIFLTGAHSKSLGRNAGEEQGNSSTASGQPFHLQGFPSQRIHFSHPRLSFGYRFVLLFYPPLLPTGS